MTSKLHIPGSAAGQLTACGRQLKNHRADRAQDSNGAIIASTATEYMTALGDGKACRHCGRAVGILPKLFRAQPVMDEDDSNE